MKLYIGGFAQGKRDYVCARFPELEVTDGGVCTPEQAAGALILDRFHLLVKRMTERGEDACAFAARLAEENKNVIVICDEVGMGVVPMDAFERTWRENVGRALCVLAREAESVERIVCGIGVKIK